MRTTDIRVLSPCIISHIFEIYDLQSIHETFMEDDLVAIPP